MVSTRTTGKPALKAPVPLKEVDSSDDDDNSKGETFSPKKQLRNGKMAKVAVTSKDDSYELSSDGEGDEDSSVDRVIKSKNTRISKPSSSVPNKKIAAKPLSTRLPANMKKPTTKNHGNKKSDGEDDEDDEISDDDDDSDSDKEITAKLRGAPSMRTKGRSLALDPTSSSEDSGNSDESNSSDSGSDSESDSGGKNKVKERRRNKEEKPGRKKKFQEKLDFARKKAKLREAAKKKANIAIDSDDDEDSDSYIEIIDNKFPPTTSRKKTDESLEYLSSDDEETNNKAFVAVNSEFAEARKKLEKAQSYHAEDVVDVSMEAEVLSVADEAAPSELIDDEDDDIIDVTVKQVKANLGPTICIKLRTRNGDETYKIKMREPFQSLMDNYVAKNKIPKSKVATVSFKFDGETLDLTQTPEAFDMENDDMVDVIVK